MWGRRDLYEFFFSSRRRHTRCALVTGVQTCALPICGWDQAVEAYDRALVLKSDSAMLYNNRGFSHLLRRDAEAAIRDFDTALQLDPQLDAPRENLRLAFAWTGQYERALVGVARKAIGRAFHNIGFVALGRAHV